MLTARHPTGARGRSRLRGYHRPVRRVALGVVLLLCLAPSALGSGTAQRQTCLKPKATLVASLRGGLRPSAHATLLKVRATRAQGRFTSVLARGVYFVSADYGKRRVATWAVSTAAYSSGHGGVFSVDANARRISAFGSLISPELLASWGVSARTKGYAASRACARK